MLTVSHVTKNYGKFCALSDISLEFENGVYGLLAPNGAGKTTLIKMLATLLFPTKGEILCDGVEIVKLGEDYRGMLGYLPQEFGYYRNYSPMRFLSYLAALKGVEPKQARKQASELLDLVGLGDVKNKKMRKFSGGMVQRVGIAQAFLGDPKILILDEPTAGLDPKERVRFRNLITQAGRDKTVIFSTHIVSDLESIANHIILFQNKQVLYNGEVGALCETLNGNIFETELEDGEAEAFRARYLSLSERQEGERVRIRFYSEKREGESWVQVFPGLEDVFLCSYRDQGEQGGGTDAPVSA